MAENPHIAALHDLRLYEVESSPEAIAARFGLDPGAIVDFSLNINPFGPPKASVEAARAALARCNEYPDLHLAALRRRLAERHGVPAETLFFGAGLDDVLKLILQAWTAEGDQVVIHIPTFPRYELEARLRGAVPILVHCNPPWRTDIAAIRAALKRGDISLLFLCTPNNPTGATISNGEIATLASEYPGTRIVVDEALIDPAKEGAVPLVRKHANVVVLRTFSKYFGLAGFRVGYGVARPELLKSLEAVRPPFNVALASAAAAQAALDDAEFVDRVRCIFAAETAFFSESIARLGRYRIRGNYSNMCLLETSAISSSELAAGLAANGILVADGKSFRGLEGVESIRVSLRDRSANERLIAAMEAVL